MKNFHSYSFFTWIIIFCVGSITHLGGMQKKDPYETFKVHTAFILNKKSADDWTSQEASNVQFLIQHAVFPWKDIINNKNFVKDIFGPLVHQYYAGVSNENYRTALQEFITIVKKYGTNNGRDTLNNVKAWLQNKFGDSQDLKRDIESFIKEFGLQEQNVEQASQVPLNALDQLARAFETFTIKQPQEEAGLLGPWIEKNYPSALLDIKSYNETHRIYQFTKQNNPPYKIYQLKVLKQDKRECGIHAFRNGLYIDDILSNPRSLFEEIYNKMISPHQYEAFIRETGCMRDQGSNKDDFDLIKHKIDQRLIKCLPDCIPKNSATYIGGIEFMSIFRHQTLSCIPKKFIDQTKFKETIQLKIKNIEPNFPSQYIEDIVSLLHIREENLPRIVDRIRTFLAQQNGLITWYLAVLSGCIVDGDQQAGGHGVVLVQHKYKGQVEYLFADSNNTELTTSLYAINFGVNIAVDSIISLTQSLDYFNSILVRYIYFQTVFLLEKYGTTKAWPILSIAYNALKNLNLFDQHLYQSMYKKAFCSLIKDLLKEGHLGKGYLGENFFADFKCS